MAFWKVDMQKNDQVILLDKNKIEKYLQYSPIDLEILHEVGSTNDYLKHRPNDKKIKICIAEKQTQGRGRLGRAWHSPFGQNIYFSMRYHFDKNMSELPGLSLVAALAVCRAIFACTSFNEMKIKWPNDILIGHEKIAGILIDMQSDARDTCCAIIGIGINVNMKEVRDNYINQAWNSLSLILQRDIDRNSLSSYLINSLMRYLEIFSVKGFSYFMDEWRGKDYLLGQSIQVMSGDNSFSGVVAGINMQGHLLLEMPDKTIKAFSAGDTSILK